MAVHPLFELVKNRALFEDLARSYGTPLYLYVDEQLRSNLETIDAALRSAIRDYHICYAIKANSNPHLLSRMRYHLPSLGGDCSSPGELEAARRAGITGSECIFTGNYESADDLQAALDAGAHINLDDITSLDRLARLGLPEEISFRLNPGFGRGTFAQIVTAGEKAKFGVPHRDLVTAYRRAYELGIRQFGLQCMTGSGNLDPDYFESLLGVILQHARELETALGIHLNYLSIGGGFGIPYRDDQEPLDFGNLFSRLGRILGQSYRRSKDRPQLWIEPGKSIVGNTGILLTRVTGIKSGYRTYIGTDAGMETLMRPALYNAYHRIYKVGEPEAEPVQVVDITGRICENTDRLAVERPFPAVKEGDLLAILDVGAYGYSMSHQFNTRPRPAEVLLVDQRPQLIRRRETIDDIFRTTKL
ncbi:MAG: diaminopimelate decarboxylase [Candidatus Neomarinimicrobiota bacterium]|nr:MAG: diaminopimelate decarboxylase [Candidatus Neomarinimicrobiota bacterium]